MVRCIYQQYFEARASREGRLFFFFFFFSLKSAVCPSVLSHGPRTNAQKVIACFCTCGGVATALIEPYLPYVPYLKILLLSLSIPLFLTSTIWVSYHTYIHCNHGAGTTTRSARRRAGGGRRRRVSGLPRTRGGRVSMYCVFSITACVRANFALVVVAERLVMSASAYVSIQKWRIRCEGWWRDACIKWMLWSFDRWTDSLFPPRTTDATQLSAQEPFSLTSSFTFIICILTLHY